MTNLDPEVRLYEVNSDGSLEPLMGTGSGYFGNTCPNVGDTIAWWGLNDVYTYYAVQRRYFLHNVLGDTGWAILIRKLEPAPQLQAVVDAWASDTAFEDELAKQEREEERKNEKDRVDKERLDRELSALLHHLHPREVRALRFMIENPLSKTIDAIPQAGEYTLNQLAAAGLIRPGRKSGGLATWIVTDEGREEIRRRDLLSVGGGAT